MFCIKKKKKIPNTIIIFCKTSKVLSGKEDLDLLEDMTGNDVLYFEYAQPLLYQ